MFFLTLKSPDSIIFLCTLLPYMDGFSNWKVVLFPLPFLSSFFLLPASLSLLFIPFLHNTSFKFRGLLESPIGYSFTGGHFYMFFAKKKYFRVDPFNSGQRINYSWFNFLTFRVWGWLLFSFCAVHTHSVV